MSKKQKQGFVYGAIVLSLSGFLCKVIGAVFRIPLTNLVGTASMSYYSSAYNVYTLLLSLSTAGIPTGIAAMISKSIALNKLKDTKSIVSISCRIFVSFGAFLTVIGLLFSKNIAILMGNEDAYYAVFYLMPAVFFISVVSVFKGFFQGYNNMVPTAVSNVIESIIKLLFGYFIAYYLHSRGYPDEQVVGGAIFGVTLSTFLAMLYMLLRYFFRDKSYRVPIKLFLSNQGTERNALTKELMVISLPIMVSSIAVSLMGAIDACVVMNSLQSYLDIETAKLMWGAYSNMSTTIFNLPSFLIITIGISLVPSISAAFALKNTKRVRVTVNKALKYSSILAFGCAFGLNAVAEESLRLFFSDASGMAIAKTLLEILSFALVAVGLSNVTSSILQSVGKAYLSVISVAVGAVVKTIVTIILVNIPSVNIIGAPIATNIAYPIMLILNFYFIYKHIHILPKIRSVFIKPLIAGVGCFAAVKVTILLLDNILPHKILILPAIAAGIVVYIVLIFALRLLTFKEFKQTFVKRKKSS